MELHQVVKELQENSQELEKQCRLKTLRKVLMPLIIGFFIGKKADKRISELNTKNDLIKKSINEHCKTALETISKQVEEIRNSGTYLTHEDKEQCMTTLKTLESDFAYLGQIRALEKEFIIAKAELEKYDQTISNYNKEFIKQRKRDYSYLFNKEYLSLDEEQKDAVITDDKYNLVVAAAGSGKTEVLITRIAYLIERKPDGAQPNRILAIAYQNKDVDEIEQRLRDRYNINDVNVKTFHKLGKDILDKTGDKIRRTDIVDDNKKHEIIKKLFEHKLKTEPDYYKLFLRYVKTLHDIEQKEDFQSKEDNLAYMRARAYFSISNVRVNSKAEKEIMDFFLMNKLNGKPVKIAYEPDLADFRPDFVLPEYDLFIEHWALNEKGEVPNWFTQTTEDYKRKMKWKKEWFARNDKLLVETYAHEYDENDPDKFIELLKKQVIEKLQTKHERKFEFAPMDYEEVVEIAWGPYKNPIDEMITFITNAKTYGLTPEKILEKLRGGRWSQKQVAFGEMAAKVYSEYEEELKKQKKIDFEDMINKAITEMLKDKSLYANACDHILIDEYQDISAQRYRLIKTLLERNPKCKLFCVGDDWQSIMAFSGSNLEFFVNFEKYFKNPAVTKISTNYRSTRTIVDAGADLIKNNGSCQIPKLTVSNRGEIKAIKVLSSPHKEKYKARYPEQTAEDCINRIAEYLQKSYAPKDILVLSRYMRTRVKRGYDFHQIIKIFLEKARQMGIEIACDDAHTQNKVRLISVHKSKGLEAKAVLILNVIKDIYGFPCEIEDPTIYAPARENYPPQDQKEEERRLFYVAMTRAKEDLIIYTWEQSKSEFLEEIRQHTQEERLTY